MPTIVVVLYLLMRGGNQMMRALRATRIPRPWRRGAASLPDPESTDLTAPHTWYPVARSTRRRVICHVGPTNSGKTAAALDALVAADSGIYCAPLRLLAAEVWEVANVMMFLASDYASYMVGEVLSVSSQHA